MAGKTGFFTQDLDPALTLAFAGDGRKVRRISHMRIVHTVASLAARHGGPSRTVAALTAALKERGLEVLLIAGGFEGSCLAGVPVEGVRVRDWTRSIATVRRFKSKILRVSGGEEPTILHDHGMWLGNNHAAASVSRRRRVPLIVSPRGMLSTWALSHHAWRKHIAWRLYQKRDLHVAMAFHATSELEYQDIRSAGLIEPVAVIPNGVEVPGTDQREDRKAGTRRALFLSRLHVVKGIEELVEAWGRVQPAGWELIIAGSDEEGLRSGLENRVRRQGLEGTIHFLGPVDDELKWDVYRGASLFILPSHSESFGLSIAEALACGVPVITSRRTPWGSVEQQRCGWWIEPDVDALVAAIGEATALPPDRLREMGQRGRVYVEEQFAWGTVAEKMFQVYEWMIGDALAPPYLNLD